MKFNIIIPAVPIIVIILCFYYIPGQIAKDINMPPKRPPRWPIPSIEDPNENSNETNTNTHTIQVMTCLIGPYFYNAFQFIIKYDINPPNIPNIEVDAPTVN